MERSKPFGFGSGTGNGLDLDAIRLERASDETWFPASLGPEVEDYADYMGPRVGALFIHIREYLD